MRAPELTFKRARELRRKMTLPEVCFGGRCAKAASLACGFAGNIRSDRIFWIFIGRRPGLPLRWRAVRMTISHKLFTISGGKCGSQSEACVCCAYQQAMS